MLTIVTPREVTDYLEEDDSGRQRLAVALAERVESFFLNAIGRADRPFSVDPIPGRIEVQDGTGSPTLWTDYPIAALTSVVLGFDSTSADETLNVADQQVLRWRIGSRRLTRVGRCGSRDYFGQSLPSTLGHFGALGAAGYVTIVYDTAPETVPEAAGLGVLRLTSTLWNQKGTENETSERIGGYSVDYGAVAKDDPFWQEVVGQMREPHL